MKEFGFSELQKALLQWPTEFPFFEFCLEGTYERISQILAQPSSDVLAKNDLMPLIRQILLQQSQSSSLSRIKVPRHPPWPSFQEWAEWGVFVMQAPDGFVLSAERWHPEWLEASSSGVFDRAFSMDRLAATQECDSDPYVSLVTGLRYYKSKGQREAVRASFFALPGSTLVVNLPTGNGKSLVAQIDVLLDGREGNMTVVVVPTVALAIDQERQMQERLAIHPSKVELFAWHADLSSEQKQQFKERIRRGRQPILFASPESICGSLVFALYDAARSGFVRRLVIDEAHLVAQWGDEFRPSFQMLAGLRSGLLRVVPNTCEPFNTLLLSATLAGETLETLATLFGPVPQVEVISAVQLRQEPEYWFHRAESSEEKRVRLLEAARHAPRPFIVYVSERADAEGIARLLHGSLGLTRIAHFHGETSATDRKSIIDGWSNNRLDVIVATSAFGVGIDKTDVRCVIHACVPETLDRFYQEVGRGGRDGRPCVSLAVYDGADIEMGRSLGRTRVIGDELGLARWEAMLRSHEARGEDRWSVDISVVPTHGMRQSDYNKAWNVRTLILMARAGVIELDSDFPEMPMRLPREPDDTYEGRQEEAAAQYFNRTTIRILNPRHREKSVWANEIQTARLHGEQSTGRNFKLLLSVLNGDVEVSDALTRLYEVDNGRWRIPVGGGCAGCPVCRRIGQKKLQTFMPTLPLAVTRKFDIAKWSKYFSGRSPEKFLVVMPDLLSSAVAGQVVKALSVAVSHLDVAEINLTDREFWRGVKGYSELARKSRWKFVIENDMRADDAFVVNQRFPAVSILTSAAGEIPLEILAARKPLHLLFVPESFIDPFAPGRRMADVWPNRMDLAQFLKKMTT
ncbi:protein DpdF [Caballeronia sordidicola]|uniref:protein DpdF n=1 Tax=Caballeronia sordidicola TaxID=196367 RepID=UPI0005530521|nr:protein DpdF [Caballeronia sordidicola]